MSTRTDIAAAASTIDGVNVTADYRQTLKVGEGFVRWSGRVIDDSRLGWIDTWQVWVGVPQDRAAGEAWVSEHLDALVAALDVELVVTAALAADLVIGTTKTNGLIIEGTRSAA
jgi:hypothetical protein